MVKRQLNYTSEPKIFTDFDQKFQRNKQRDKQTIRLNYRSESRPAAYLQDRVLRSVLDRGIPPPRFSGQRPQIRLEHGHERHLFDSRVYEVGEFGRLGFESCEQKSEKHFEMARGGDRERETTLSSFLSLVEESFIRWWRLEFLTSRDFTAKVQRYF